MYKNLARILAFCLPFCLLQASDCAPANDEQVASEEETENYPFKKSQSQIPNEEVVGIRIKDNKIILLSSDYSFSSTSISEKNKFSDINFFTQYPKLISVEICGMTLTKEVVENLRKHMPTTILSLIIDSCKIEDAQQFAGVINEHKQLKSLTLRLFNSESADTEAVLQALTEEHSNLVYLNLGFGTLNNNSMFAIGDLITHSLATLKQISLAWVKAEDINADTYNKLLNALGEAQHVERFELSTMSLPQDYAKMFFEAIGHMQHLMDLKIYVGNFNEYESVSLYESTEALQAALNNLSALESLDISGSNWTSEPLQLIFRSIANMKRLQTLDISGNTLDVQSAETLSNSIQEAGDIRSLFANDCSMTDEIFSALCKNLQNTGLRYLYFRGNKIKGGAKSLPISSMEDVLVIDFSQNDMSYDNTMDFIKSTADHPKLHIVNFKNNSGIELLTGAERTIRNDELVEWKIKNNSKVSFFGL